MNLPAHIERRIERIPFSGCWIWMGSSSRYGHIWHQGKVARAHRVIFQLAGGEIPTGMELLHSCDIGLCVNPYHLSAGTHMENMADMVRKGRSRAPVGDAHWTKKNPAKAQAIGRRNIVRTHASGALNNNAKLTQQIADQMRAAYAAQPNLSMTELGRNFGIGREQARKIIKGVVWKS